MSGFPHLPGWDSLSPDLRREFADARIPASFLPAGSTFHFAAGPDLTEADVPPLGRVLRFGHRDHSDGGFYCRDAATGHVHLVTNGEPGLVNTSLASFGDSLRLILGVLAAIRTGDDVARQEAAIEIKAGIAAIDDDAIEEADHWSSFADDVQAGDYDVQDQPLRSHPESPDTRRSGH